MRSTGTKLNGYRENKSQLHLPTQSTDIKHCPEALDHLFVSTSSLPDHLGTMPGARNDQNPAVFGSGCSHF